MTPAAIEKFLLSLPGAKLSIQWEGERVFKIGGKMFALMAPRSERPQRISFKTSDDSFHILTQAGGIVPSPYLARAHWVKVAPLDALRPGELRAYLARAHELVAAKLPKKTQDALKRARKTDRRQRQR
jgi:predicted DNA-binding protein (MmcQ/YjbR family)